MQAADSIENSASQAAPASAASRPPPPLWPGIQSQALTQKMLGAELRQEAARLAPKMLSANAGRLSTIGIGDHPMVSSRLGPEIAFAGLRIHGYGDVLLNDQPLAVSFSIDIGDAHGHVPRFTGFRFREVVLEAVAVGYRSVDIDRKVLYLE